MSNRCGLEWGSTDPSRLANCYLEDFGGTRWQIFDSDADNVRSRRLVVNRTNPSIQWLGTNASDPNDRQSFLSTQNGWQTSAVMIANEFGDDNSVYGLAIDDNATAVQYAVVTLTDQSFDNVYTTRGIECNSVAITTDAGQTWQVQSLWEVFPDAWGLYNVQVSMIPDRQQPGNFVVYLLGRDALPNGMLSAWGMLTPDGRVVWHTSETAQFINRITPIYPSYPMDLAVDLHPQGTGFSLMAVTSEGVYFAHHNGVDENIPWERRPNSVLSAMETQGYWKVASDPTDRGASYAVAGFLDSYLTTDCGMSWNPVHSSGQMKLYSISGQNSLLIGWSRPIWLI